MNIQFELIEAQNFKSIGEAITINYKDFSGLNFVIGTNLDNPGSKNGCGKTVLLIDCLVFALYGRTIKSISNQYLSNRYLKKKLETYSKVTFVSDNVRYRSECYCNKSSLKMLLYKEDSNEESGWKDITQSSILKTKAYIQDEILKCSFDVFKSAIIIAASDCLNFYDGMTKSQKRSYVENIFNLNCFGDMYDSIKLDMNNLKKEIQFTNSEILNLNTQLDQIKSKYESHKSNIIEESKKLKQEIINLANNYKEKEKELNIYKEKENNLEITNNLADLGTKETKLLNEKSSLESSIYKAKAKIDSINEIIKEIEKIKDGLCEICVHTVDKKYDYEKQLKSIKALKKFINEKMQKIEIVKNNLKQISEEKSTALKNINEKTNISNKIKDLSLSLTYIKNQIKTLKTNLDNNNLENNPFKELYDNSLKLVNSTSEKLNQLNINYKHLDILKSVCSETGIKQYIIKDIVVLLNSLIQKYLNEIGAEYLVYFDESFEFKFITIDGECEYNNFSAGEKQRIQIATILAIRDLILNGKINSNILIIDEVLDIAIDSLAIKKIISILQRKSIDSNQALFIISHRSEITDENIFNRILEIKKENGISTLNVI